MNVHSPSFFVFTYYCWLLLLFYAPSGVLSLSSVSSPSVISTSSMVVDGSSPSGSASASASASSSGSGSVSSSVVSSVGGGFVGPNTSGSSSSSSVSVSGVVASSSTIVVLAVVLVVGGGDVVSSSSGPVVVVGVVIAVALVPIICAAFWSIVWLTFAPPLSTIWLADRLIIWFTV